MDNLKETPVTDITQRLLEQNKILRQGIQAVRAVIDASEGVSGLHLNGDTAEWEDLLVGGYLEDWLIDFSEAEEIISND